MKKVQYLKYKSFGLVRMFVIPGNRFKDWIGMVYVHVVLFQILIFTLSLSIHAQEMACPELFDVGTSGRNVELPVSHARAFEILRDLNQNYTFSVLSSSEDPVPYTQVNNERFNTVIGLLEARRTPIWEILLKKYFYQSLVQGSYSIDVTEKEDEITLSYSRRSPAGTIISRDELRIRDIKMDEFRNISADFSNKYKLLTIVWDLRGTFVWKPEHQTETIAILLSPKDR